jgi:hypothetical protein
LLMPESLLLYLLGMGVLIVSLTMGFVVVFYAVVYSRYIAGLNGSAFFALFFGS